MLEQIAQASKFYGPKTVKHSINKLWGSNTLYFGLNLMYLTIYSMSFDAIVAQLFATLPQPSQQRPIGGIKILTIFPALPQSSSNGHKH